MARNVWSMVVWCYRDQKAHWYFARRDGGRVADLFAADRDSLVKIESRAALGVAIDGSGGGSEKIHSDAEEIHNAILAMRNGLSRTFVEFAISGAEPETIDKEFTAAPVIARNGRPDIYDATNGRACRVRYLPDPESVRMARELRSAWRQWCRELAMMLARRGQLSRHQKKSGGILICTTSATFSRMAGNRQKSTG